MVRAIILRESLQEYRESVVCSRESLLPFVTNVCPRHFCYLAGVFATIL